MFTFHSFINGSGYRGTLEPVQGIVEHGVIALFQNLGDRSVTREALALQVGLCIVEAVSVLHCVGIRTDPHKDFVLHIKDKDIIRVQHGLVDLRARALLRELEFS